MEDEPTTTTTFTCQECGHEWEDTMPLFAPCRNCKQQGCKGTAEPADNLPLKGVEPISPSSKH